MPDEQKLVALQRAQKQRKAKAKAKAAKAEIPVAPAARKALWSPPKPPPPVRESPDTQDYRRKAQEQNIARGASPHGGPGRASRARSERVVRRSQKGRATAREVQMLLRKEGYQLAADNVWGPKTQAAWVDYQTKLRHGQAENVRARQQRYLQTALTSRPNPRKELALFGMEGAQELNQARQDLARMRIQAQAGRARAALPGQVDAGRMSEDEEVALALEQSGIFNVARQAGQATIPIPYALPWKGVGVYRPGAVRSAEVVVGENIVKALRGEEYNEQWAAVEAALWGTGPIRGLAAAGRAGKALIAGKGAGEAARVAREANRGGQVIRAGKKLARQIPLRTFEVGGAKVSREASRSRTGRLIEGIADKLRNTEAQAGKELGYSTRFKQNILQVPADVLKKVGRKLNDEQEYALRILAEGEAPAIRIAHHTQLAQSLPNPELVNYHLAHIGWTQKASRYVQTSPEGVLSLSVDAPRHMHQAWEWFQRAGDLREDLLKELGRLSDDRIMYRLHAPARVLRGARFKKFERKIQAEMEADPARQEAFAWIDQQYADDPVQASALKAYYDSFVRSTAERANLPVSEVMRRIKSVESDVQLEDLPQDLFTLFQSTAESLPLKQSDELPIALPAKEIAQRIKGEGYVMPPGFGTTQSFARRIDTVFRLARQGQKGRDWYQRAAMNVVQGADRMGFDRKTFAQLVAIYSQSAETNPNFQFAVKAAQEFMEHGEVRSLGAGGGPQRQKVNALLQGGNYAPKSGTKAEKEANSIVKGQWKGRKTNSFFANIIEDVDQNEYLKLGLDEKPVTVDIWVARMFGLHESKITNKGYYDTLERTLQEMAREVGWEPKEIQAAAWVTAKGRDLMKRWNWSEGQAMEHAMDAYERGFDRTNTLFPVTGYAKNRKFGTRAEPEPKQKETLFQRHKAGTQLEGLPPKGSPNVIVQRLAEKYTKRAGIDYHPPHDYVEVDPERATRIAQAYEEMPHAPDDPLVAASYKAMIDETLEQYNDLVAAGYVFEFPEGEYPYASPWDAMRDLKENKHLYVFPTEAGFGTENVIRDHPLLADSGIQWGGRPVTHNDIFRGVHDAFGHHKEGVGFRADGEENAWRQHVSMYSEAARGAMTSETRGQNSWVNFGPHAEANRTANEVETVYADQKAGLLPAWAVHDGSGDLYDRTYELLRAAQQGGDWANGIEGVAARLRDLGYDTAEIDTAFMSAGRRIREQDARGDIEGEAAIIPDDPRGFESAEDFHTRMMVKLAGLSDQGLAEEVVLALNDGRYDDALAFLSDALSAGGADEALARAISKDIVEAMGGERPGSLREAMTPEERDIVDQAAKERTAGLDPETEHSVWDIVTKIVDDPAFGDDPGLLREIDEIAAGIEGAMNDPNTSFLGPISDIRGVLDGVNLPPSIEGHFNRLLDNVKDLQRQRAQQAIEQPMKEEPIPLIGNQIFAKDTDPAILKAYDNVVGDNPEALHERGLEAALNAAVKADDFETAQTLHNMLVGNKQIPGVKRETTEGELFQRLRAVEGEGKLSEGDRVRGAKGSGREQQVGFIQTIDGPDEVRVQWYPLDSDVETRSLSELEGLPKQGHLRRLKQRGGSLEEVGPYGYKGATQFDDQNLARILLTEAADVTTLPHEIAHVMRRMMTPQQERVIAKAAGAKLVGKGNARVYKWDEAAEEWFADAVAKVIRTGIAPAGAKKQFRALAKAFREVFDEAELPDVPPHVHEAITKMFDYKPKPGGRIFGYEDIEHGVAYAPTWRGMPFKITRDHRATAEYIRRVSNALFGGGRRRAMGAGPDDDALRHSYEGSALMTGFFRKDVIGPKLEKAVLANRMAAAAIARKTMVDAGSEIPRFADDIAVKVDPSLSTSDEVKRFWDKIDEFGERKLGPEHLDDVNFELIEEARRQVIPSEIDGRPVHEIAKELMDIERPLENYVWVPKDFMDKSGLLYVPKAVALAQRGLSKWQRRALAGTGFTWDAINDLVKAQILWLNPAYAPVQFMGNTVMNLMHQGPFAAVSGWKSVTMLRQMELPERLTLDRAMGQGFSTAITAGTDIGSSLQHTLGHWNNIVADLLPRRMAFMHEARRSGYKKIDEVSGLLKRAQEGEQKALDELEQIARRARRSIVDFDRMSAFEKDVLTRYIFFYPWLRGATDYSINFAKDHPAQALALALMYEHMQATQQDILGDHPYYTGLDVPLSTDSVGLKVPFTAADISLSDATGDKTWRDENGLPMVFKIRQLFTQTTPLELAQTGKAFASGDREAGLDAASHLTPVPLALGKAIFGYDPYEGQEIEVGPLTFLNELNPKDAPLTDRIRKIFFTSDEERADYNEKALYPREKRHQVMRLAGGSLAPTPYNPKIGQERARKLKPTLERKVEELQVEAKEYGIDPPSPEVLEDLKWRTEYESRESRNMSYLEKAKLWYEVYEERHGKKPFPRAPRDEREAREVLEDHRSRLYPWILWYERQLENAEDHALDSAG